MKAANAPKKIPTLTGDMQLAGLVVLCAPVGAGLTVEEVAACVVDDDGVDTILVVVSFGILVFPVLAKSDFVATCEVDGTVPLDLVGVIGVATFDEFGVTELLLSHSLHVAQIIKR